MTRVKQIAQRLAEAAMFIPGPLTKHHSSLLLVRRDDIAEMLLNAGLRVAVEALETMSDWHDKMNLPWQEIVKGKNIAKEALAALKGEIKPYNAANDPEIRAALQRTVNGDA